MVQIKRYGVMVICCILFLPVVFAVNFGDISGWISAITGKPTLGASFVVRASSNPSAWNTARTNFSSILTAEVGNFSANWTDDEGLAMFIFSTNESGVWINQSAVSLSGVENTSSYEYTIQSAEGLHSWKVYANDTHNNWNVTDDQDFIITDTAAPAWSGPATNFTTVNTGDSGNFSSNWTDGVNLSYFIFSSNDTGSWVNQTPVKMTGTSNISSYQYTITALTSTNVSWKFFVNDSSENWNQTDEQTFIVGSTGGPAWSIVEVNSTRFAYLDFGNFSANWTDDTGLSTFTFSTNDSGDWVNFTEQFSGIENTSHKEYQIKSLEGRSLSWLFYVNDTDGNWNQTDVQDIIVGQTIDNGGRARPRTKVPAGVVEETVKQEPTKEKSSTETKSKSTEDTNAVSGTEEDVAFFRESGEQSTVVGEAFLYQKPDTLKSIQQQFSEWANLQVAEGVSEEEVNAILKQYTEKALSVIAEQQAITSTINDEKLRDSAEIMNTLTSTGVKVEGLDTLSPYTITQLQNNDERITLITSTRNSKAVKKVTVKNMHSQDIFKNTVTLIDRKPEDIEEDFEEVFIADPLVTEVDFLTFETREICCEGDSHGTSKFTGNAVTIVPESTKNGELWYQWKCANVLDGRCVGEWEAIAPVQPGLQSLQLTISPADPLLAIGPDPSLNYCGDGECSGREMCSSCAIDCGQCFRGENGCLEQWDCKMWSDWDEEKMRYRDCIDLNACGTTVSKPIIAELCPLARVSEKNNFSVYFFSAFVLLIVGFIARSFLIHRPRRN